MNNYQTQLLNVLNENKNRKVGSIIDEIMSIPFPDKIEKQKRQNTFLLDKHNNTFAIFCYYHKQWELVSTTDYGKKSNTKTGLNTMCKEGVRNWTKQQKEYTKVSQSILDKLMNEEITNEEAQEIKQQAQSDKDTIVPSTTEGYSLEEILVLLEEYNSKI